jgi:2-C-methyl-D-erythritol 4-phosphate cytidylyltransferase / 2-C-methyl-D-erythritol 2,4-cyclodiphosphate synthase
VNHSLGIVLVCGGVSSRFGGDDKQMVSLRGAPVFAHSLALFEASSFVRAIAVVFSARNIEEGRRYIEQRGFGKVVAVTAGGPRRQDSVNNGLHALLSAAECGYVAVHDGARPFVDEPMIERGLRKAAESGAAIAAVPAKDTVKVVGPDHVVLDTPDRRALWLVQTPQVFSAELLVRAHAEITVDVTDDASMVERLGVPVAVFEGDYANIKLTTPDDMRIAEAIHDMRSGLASHAPGASVVPLAGTYANPLTAPAFGTMAGTQATPGNRWGIGFDGHRLEPGGPLRLGGVDIPFEMRLAGHSDGDVLLHALTSAVLGAAGLGDIGSHFPSSDPRWKGSDSAEFLRKGVTMALDAGWEVAYLDATIIAQQPRLSPYVEKMQAEIASLVGISVGNVNVKVTSTDHVGAIGAGEGIAAQAIATIRTV